MGLSSLSFRTRLLLVAAIELAYAALSRTIYDLHTQGVSNGLYIERASYGEIEVIRTIPRLIAAALLWALMKQFIRAPATDTRPLRSPLLAMALVLNFAAPVLTGGYTGFPGDVVFIALASWPVAVHEELFFRAILQRLLITRLGSVLGMALTVLIFMLFHVGVSAPTFANFANIALSGLILGLVYAKTHSLAAVIVIHGIDDTLYSLPIPFVQLPYIWSLGVMIPAAVLLCWTSRDLLQRRT